jgi:hypothetical protein
MQHLDSISAQTSVRTRLGPIKKKTILMEPRNPTRMDDDDTMGSEQLKDASKLPMRKNIC